MPWYVTLLILPFAFLIVGWVLGIISSLLKDWLRVKLSGPKLSLEIDPDHILASAENGEKEKFYVRVKVKNVKGRIAHACRGHLVAVEEWDGASQAFVPVFSDSVPLLWSYYARAETFDIPQNVPLCVDVLICKQECPGIDLQIWSNNGVLRPSKLAPFREKSGTYRFKVLVSANDIAPKLIVFKVTWDGTNWPPQVEVTTCSNSG